MKNSKGFAVLEGLLILVIVGILGGTGWYVYQAHNKATDSLTNADAANSSVLAKPKSSSNVSGDLTTYENTAAKVKFTYPISWAKGAVPAGAKPTFSIIKDSDFSEQQGCSDCNVKYDSQNKNFYLQSPTGAKTVQNDIDPVAQNDKLTAYIVPLKGDFNCGTFAVLIHYSQNFVETKLGMCSKPTSADEPQPPAGTLMYEDVVSDLPQVFTTFKA